MTRTAGVAAVITACCVWATAAEAAKSTLSTVKARGQLVCGVSEGLPGFSHRDVEGRWSGLDVDFCRALASAVLGKSAKVRFRALSSKDRFDALISGKVDVLARNTTWTLSRDTALGLNFAGVLFHDGQGFMVRKELGVKNALELDGVTVCAHAGTTTEINVAEFFRSRRMTVKLIAFEKTGDALTAYRNGKCEVYSADRSGLYAQRSRLAAPDNHKILAEVISKEPLGPAVRHGDDAWLEVVRWTLFALINAEELGVTSENAGKLVKESKNPEILRLLGGAENLGKKIGLDPKWALRAVKAVGNYGEIFGRNLGPKSPLKISRGLNRLWSDGGILYAPPIK